MPRARDIYGRKPTSQSRGRTQERILAMQHAPGTLPGAEELLGDPAPGSVGAAIVAFHRGWVEAQYVTSRRAYERSLVLLARDLAQDGPPLDAPLAQLTADRLEAHLAWRVRQGLDHEAELVRAGVHLGRLAEWLDSEAQTAFGPLRERLRAAAALLA